MIILLVLLFIIGGFCCTTVDKTFEAEVVMMTELRLIEGEGHITYCADVKNIGYTTAYNVTVIVSLYNDVGEFMERGITLTNPKDIEAGCGATWYIDFWGDYSLIDHTKTRVNINWK